MQPKSVKLDGTDISNIEDVHIVQINPVDRGGYPVAKATLPARIHLHRDASVSPSVSIFKLATNGDGTKKEFDGEIVMQNSQGEETYRVIFKTGYVEEWRLAQHRELGNAIGPIAEYVAIRVEDLEVHADGDNASIVFVD